MKSNLKKVAAMALGLAALAPTVQNGQKTDVQKTQSQSQSKTQNQKEQITHRPIDVRNVVRQMAGGFHVEGNRSGIPPHIYGAYHVRRGTHKRSNFKA